MTAQKSPDAFKTISEAATELGVEQHVLRFWETKFPQIKPLKRRGGRRFYRPEDMEVLHRIHDLLYTHGFTIKGAKKALSTKGEPVLQEADAAPNASAGARKAKKKADTNQLDLLGDSGPGLTSAQRKELQQVLGNLQSMRKRLQSVS